MENWATNTGAGSTVGADGAFERFLTAAIATIITIMFSWRLLVENVDENGEVNASYPTRQQLLALQQRASGGPPPGDPEPPGNRDGHQSPRRVPIPVGNQRSHLTSGHDVMECKYESQIHSSQSSSSVPQRCGPPMDEGDDDFRRVNTPGEGVNDPEGDDNPAWGYNNWEDDTYWNINTRRKPRDFMTSQVRSKSESSDQSYTAGSDSSDPEGGGPSTASEGEDEQYVNREYRSIVDNDNYSNMMEDRSTESDTSDSEEGEYEPPPMVDSDEDEEANYSNALEPIIEEDSDDMYTSDDETIDENQGKRDSSESADISESDEGNIYDGTLQCDNSYTSKDDDNKGVCDGRGYKYDTDEIRTGTCRSAEDVYSPECVIETDGRDQSSPADIPVVPGADDTSTDHVDLFTSRREGPGPAIVNAIEGERSQAGDTEHCMNERRIPKPDINKYRGTDLDLNPPADNSSVPESPVRTCAVEDLFDGYVSDESCSSASVVTVVSLDVEDDEGDDINQNRSTNNALLHGETQQQHSIGRLSDEEDNASDSNSEECFDGDGECVEKSDSVIHIPQLVESEWTEIETNNNCQPPVGLKEGVIDIALIEGDNRQKTSEFTYKDFITDIKVTSDEIVSPSAEVREAPNSTLIVDIIDPITETPVSQSEETTYRSDRADTDGNSGKLTDEEMFALSQLASIPEEAEDHEENEDEANGDTESDEKPMEAIDIAPIEAACVSQLESVNTEFPEKCSVSIISYQNVDDDEEDEFTGLSVTEESDDTVPRFQNISTTVQDYVNSSDDDVEPREYNPYEDDFAEFEFHQDSDEDSFFLVMGDQSHLRKLDTVTNLDALGLNAASDGYDVQPSEDGKSVVFSKTEEVYTDHHVRYFTEDRMQDTPEVHINSTIEEQDEDAPNEHENDTTNIPNGDMEVACVVNGVNGDKAHVSEEDLSDPIQGTIDRPACNSSGNLITDNDQENNSPYNKGSKHELLFEHGQLEQLRDMSTSLENTRDTSDNDRTSDSHSDLSSADMTGSGDIRMRSLQEYVIEQSSRESLNEALHIDEELDSGIQCNSFSPNQSGLSPDNRQLNELANVNSRDTESQNADDSCEDVSNVELFINESDLNIDKTERDQETSMSDHRRTNESDQNQNRETTIDDVPSYYSNLVTNRQKETCIDDIPSAIRQKETCIDDILSTNVHKETCIDDIPSTNVHKETCIDDIPSTNVQKETCIDDIPSTNVQRETCIDDIPSTNVQKETCIDDIPSTNVHKETCIDDIPSTNVQKETCIDDIPSTNVHKETCIDDIPSTNVHKETCIDDIPSKNREKETCIDDIPSTNVHKETCVDDIPSSSHRKETCIDDVPSSYRQNEIDGIVNKMPKETILDDSLPSLPTNKHGSPTNYEQETIIDDIVSSKQTTIDDVSLTQTSDSPQQNFDDELSKSQTSTKRETAIDDPVVSEVLTSSTIDDLESAIAPCIEQYTKSVNSPTKLKPEVESVSCLPENIADSNTASKNQNTPDVPKFGWVVRTSVVNPSGLKGIKAKISKQQERSRMRIPELYKSVLTEPIVINASPPVIRTPEQKPLPIIRQKIISSRHRFLSADNLTDTVSAQFDHFKSSVSKTQPKQRIYTRRDTTPAQKTRRILSFERVDTVGISLRHNSSDDSFERPPIDKLHKDCIFSAHKHKEILDTAESIDKLHEPLLSYGSVSSLVETDIDSGETFETFYLHETDVDMFGFQHIPLQRTASMSDMMTSKNQEEQKTRKGRFADRNMPKSKSLMTLETNIDEEVEGDGSLKRVPSIHELRVAKSLQKLNVPDWYKKSSVSRSGSTYSLFSSDRRDSTSTLDSIGYAMSTTSCPCPSISPTSGAVVIKTRVIPSSANRFLRAPKLPVTPEKSPLPPMNFRLPSDKLRNKDKSKELMPIPVVPFSQLRLMFETGKKKTSPVKKTPSLKTEKVKTVSPLPSPDVPDHPASSPVTSSPPPPILKVTSPDQLPTNGTTTNGREEETRVKNGRVRISEPEVTNIKPVPPEKPASLSKKESSQEKSSSPAKKGFFSHFKKQKSSSTKSAPASPPAEPEKLKPSIKPQVPAKPVKSRKDEVNSSSVETTV